MNKTPSAVILDLIPKCVLALLTVTAMTAALWLVGRNLLGEGAIALLYLIPVIWSASRMGLVPGICAALSATLFFDYLFIPPFYTFTVGTLEGWLVLAAFLGVAIFVVERIQASINQAREAVLLYELSSALAAQADSESVARTVAQHVQQMFQARLVKFVYDAGDSFKASVSQPENISLKDRPDIILPIQSPKTLIGEIHIWQGPYTQLPAGGNRLTQNIASQAALAIERVHKPERIPTQRSMGDTESNHISAITS